MSVSRPALVPIAMNARPVLKRPAPQPAEYQRPITLVHAPECINTGCISRTAASGAIFAVADNSACMVCGTLQSAGGVIGDLSDMTFRECEEDEVRRIDAVKRKRTEAPGIRFDEDECKKHPWHSRVSELDTAIKVMKANADRATVHLLPKNIPHLPLGSELVDLQRRGEEIEEQLKHDVGLYEGFEDCEEEIHHLCIDAVVSITGGYVDGLDPRVDFIGANLSGTGEARPVKDVQELLENVHTHISRYVTIKREQLTAADTAYRLARKASLDSQFFPVAGVEEDGVTPVTHRKYFNVEQTGPYVESIPTKPMSYSDACSAKRKLLRGNDVKDDAPVVAFTLVPLLRAIFGWVTFLSVFNGASSNSFGEESWLNSSTCVLWHQDAQDILLRYRAAMLPLKPVQNHQAVFCMHAIIIASWQTETPLSWKRVRPMFMGQFDDKLERKRNFWLHWSANKDRVEVPYTRLNQLLEEVRAIATKLCIQPSWCELTRKFANFFEDQLLKIYRIQAPPERTVKALVVKACGISSHRRRSTSDELRAQIGVADGSVSSAPTPSLSLAAPTEAASAAPLPMLPAIVDMHFPSFGSPSPPPPSPTSPAPAMRLMDFTPQVVAIACVRQVLGSVSFFVNANALADDHLEDTVNIKALRKAHCQKRPRVSVVRGGVDSATIKAETFSELAGVESKDVVACMRLLPDYSPFSRRC